MIFWTSNAFIFGLIDLWESCKLFKFFYEGEGDAEEDRDTYSSFSTTFI